MLIPKSVIFGKNKMQKLSKTKAKEKSFFVFVVKNALITFIKWGGFALSCRGGLG